MIRVKREETLRLNPQAFRCMTESFAMMTQFRKAHNALLCAKGSTTVQTAPRTLFGLFQLCVRNISK